MLWRTLVLVLVGLICCTLLVDLPQPGSPSIDQLIKQLASEEFTEREAASEALENIGEPAMKALRTAAAEMRKVTDDFEVLVVNDGSKDKTGAILDRLAVELSFVRVIHHERNLGYGAALITGFANARKDLIFYTDGDGQYDVKELHNLLERLAPNIDLVNGYKVRRADAWYRIWIGAMYRQVS